MVLAALQEEHKPTLHSGGHRDTVSRAVAPHGRAAELEQGTDCTSSGFNFPLRNIRKLEEMVANILLILDILSL